MAIIRVKRGTSTPNTSNLSYIGELAFDYNNNALFARSVSSVVKIGGETELVYYYQGSIGALTINYAFDRNYIYKIHVLASTTANQLVNSLINYRVSGLTNNLGSFINLNANDVYSGVSNASSRNTSSFSVFDAYSATVTPSSGITKVIDFEISAALHTNVETTQQWFSKGYSICSATGQSNTGITYADFAHSFSGSFGAIRINSGFTLGTRSLAITIYRTRRR
jgi:hypothetical protein